MNSKNIGCSSVRRMLVENLGFRIKIKYVKANQACEQDELNNLLSQKRGG